MAVTREDIASALAQALAPSRLEVQDDSHLHAGHAGAREGRHFSVRIDAEAFRGLPACAGTASFMMPSLR